MNLIYFALIPNAAGSAIVLERGDAGWALPAFRFAEPHFWQDVAPLNAAIQARFDLAAWTLRCLTVVDDDAAAQARFYYLHELQPGAADSGNDQVSWIDLDQLDELPFALAEQRGIIGAWRAGRHAPPGPDAVPWYRPGWSAAASAWIAEQLSAHGLLNPAIAQRRSWGRSAIWLADSPAGRFYFKAVPAMFAHEVALAVAFPEFVAPALAVDQDRGWLLMRSAGTQQLSSIVGLDPWIAAIKRYAAIQLALVPQAERLLALGLPDQRVAALEASLDALISESSLRAAGLNLAETANLLARKAELAALLGELAALPIPATIEHGDFWPGQIVLNPGPATVIDWSDSSLSHPFFSLHMFMARLADHLPGV
ncbi:MAG TPA: hypothetical protein VD886_00180, partial [Herpetosiphonaceae bacterium]|nr:hypothetical protein [Herpetosiphonaceae bacterium]